MEMLKGRTESTLGLLDEKFYLELFQPKRSSSRKKARA